MRRLQTLAAVFLIQLIGCGVQLPESGYHPVPGVDYGTVPTDYDQIVERHIQLKYDLALSVGAKELVGPFQGSLRLIRVLNTETVYGYEVHVWFDNDVHYMVLIRDDKIVESVECGSRNEGFGFFNFNRPDC